EEHYRELRVYIHERSVLSTSKSDTLNRIHRVLTLMNIKFQHIISDIEGVAGMKILEHIARGATTVEAILQGVNTTRLKAAPEDLEKSLEGIFKPQFTTVLKNHLEAYRFYQKQMQAYEVEIE